MKNIILKLGIPLIFVLSLVLTACGEEWVPSVSDFQVKDGVASSGITEGSTFSEFAESYRDFPLQIAEISETDEGTVQVFNPYTLPKEDEMPEATQLNMTLMTSYFFVDNKPRSTESLMEETGMESLSLIEHLRSDEYLAEHKVVFRYIFFEFENGIVTSVSGDYFDYNNELTFED